MICRVCHTPQPGPHKFSCSPYLREYARMRPLAERADAKRRKRMDYLLKGSVPWDDAPTNGVMLARLDAFILQYAGALEQDAREMRDADAAATLLDKAARAHALAKPKIRWMYS